VSASVLNLESAGRRLMLPDDFLAGLLADFRDKYQTAAADIHDLLDGGQAEEAGRLAHSLKGLAGTLGAEPLQDAAARAEAAVANGNPAGIEAALAHLDECLVLAVAEIERFLASR